MGNTTTEEILYTTNTIFNDTDSSLVKKTVSNGTGSDGTFESTNFIFHGILLVVVGAIGIIGNLYGMGTFVMLKRPLKFHWLMTTLLIFDTLFIIAAFFIFALPQLSEDYKVKIHSYLGPKILPFIQIAMTGAIYSKVAFTVERYLVVCHPFYIVSHEWPIKAYIIPLVSFSILYNLPKFFELDTFVCEDSLKHEEHIKNNALPRHNVSDSFYTPTAMRKNEHYKQIYLTGMNIVFMGIGPGLILITLNGLTLISLAKHQATQRYSGTTVNLAKISLAIVFTSILFHSVKWVPTVYEFVDLDGYEASLWILPFEHVSHFLLVFNSSINYYIYFFTRSNVRRKLRNWTQDSFKFMRKPTNEMALKSRRLSPPLKASDQENASNCQDTMITEPMLASHTDPNCRYCKIVIGTANRTYSRQTSRQSQ